MTMTPALPYAPDQFPCVAKSRERNAPSTDGAGVTVAGLVGEAPNLKGGAVDQGDTNTQTPQEGNVQQEVAEVLVLHNRPVQGDDEDPVAEARDVVENLAKVGQVEHSSLWPAPGGVDSPVWETYNVAALNQCKKASGPREGTGRM